jgi:hypothetical protein
MPRPLRLRDVFTIQRSTTMNSLLNTPHTTAPATERTLFSNLAFGACSALMPYVLATLLLVAFG